MAEMRKGERRVLKVQPEFGFGHKECEFHLPDDAHVDEDIEMMMDVQLLNWYDPRDVISVMGSSSDFILKTVLTDGEGYENPRPPYKVTSRNAGSREWQCSSGSSVYGIAEGIGRWDSAEGRSLVCNKGRAHRADNGRRKRSFW